MPLILAMWHGQHFLVPFVRKPEHPVKVLVSRHRDGEINAIAAERLGVGTIRGVESRGMMCSERELQISDEHNGIIELPGDAPVNPFGQFLQATNPAAFLRDYPYDVSSVDDDRPFFFYTVQPCDLWNFVTTMNKDSADYKINRAVPMLFSLVGVSLLATLIILALPPLVLHDRDGGKHSLEAEAILRGQAALEW